jgi:hypothetical protein
LSIGAERTFVREHRSAEKRHLQPGMADFQADSLEWTDMSGTAAQGFPVDPLAILGFGFIGLAFLMAILAYRSLKEVIAAPNPRENVIKLARLFMYLSLALLIAAGPLQLALLWAQSAFAPKPVKLTIGLASTTWEPEYFGEVGIMKAGKFHKFAPEPLVTEFGEGDELNIQLDRVAQKIEKMRAQILVVSRDRELRPDQPIPEPSPSDPAALATNGG